MVVDLKKLFEEGDVNANVPVYDGDSIYVPKASFVYVNGEVKNPGAYKITLGLDRAEVDYSCRRIHTESERTQDKDYKEDRQTRKRPRGQKWTNW